MPFLISLNTNVYKLTVKMIPVFDVDVLFPSCVYSWCLRYTNQNRCLFQTIIV